MPIVARLVLLRNTGTNYPVGLRSLLGRVLLATWKRESRFRLLIVFAVLIFLICIRSLRTESLSAAVPLAARSCLLGMVGRLRRPSFVRGLVTRRWWMLMVGRWWCIMGRMQISLSLLCKTTRLAQVATLAFISRWIVALPRNTTVSQWLFTCPSRTRKLSPSTKYRPCKASVVDIGIDVGRWETATTEPAPPTVKSGWLLTPPKSRAPPATLARSIRTTRIFATPAGRLRRFLSGTH